MSRYLVVVLSIVMMAATAVIAGACGMQPGGTQQEVGKMQEESKSVDLKNADSVRAQLKMGAGELNVTGGAETSSWKETSPTTSQSGSPRLATA